jgi:acetyltransferase-like isoleucine patch superfamily enzyme
MSFAASTKQWLKHSDAPLARRLFVLAKRLHQFTLPCFPPLHRPLYELHIAIRNLSADFIRMVWTTPLFKSRVSGSAKNLYLYSGLPVILGPLDIELGDNIRLSGITTLSGRTASKTRPLLKVGNNTGIGWQTTIAVGTKILIGDNVHIAGKAFLAGYPGHPLEPVARAAGLPDRDDQCGDIIIEDNVWLATGVTVMAGVTIGKDSVVAAGSVVTKNIPAGVLAGGMPAKIIRCLDGSRYEP